MGIISVRKDRIVFQKRDEIAVIEPWGRDCLRFRSTPNASLTEENWNLLLQPEGDCIITQDEKRATITNGKLTAEINDAGKVIYYKNGKAILTERSEMAFNARYREYRAVGADNHRATVIFMANEKEHFYGLGQEQNDCFDLKGSTSHFMHKNTKSSIPFVYSSIGYGFLWNNPSIGHCELTNNHTLWEANSTKQIDYLVIAGDTPAEVMAKYADLTGHAPTFPKWASGFWQSKLRYEDQEELLSVAREYKERGIPLAAIVIDFFHWPEQGDWKFDSKYWPEPKKMSEELENLGVKAIVSIWPTTNPDSENYKYMDERNMLLRTENGQYGLFNFNKLQTYVDPTNPNTRDYMWSKVYENYYNNGIKNYWLDEAEPEIHPTHFDNLRFFLGNGEEVALVYPYYYTKLFYEGLKKTGEQEIISLTRAAWIGSQRYGTLVWNGDVPSTFDALRMSVKTGLNMAMCGIPWWNSDIGGFWGGDPESDSYRELLVRWFQFGIFCPVTRLHGVRNRAKDFVERNPGVREPSGGDNEIWSYGDRVYRILKNLIELRERLRPYLHRYMDTASKIGAPVIRPMFYEFPEDESCYSLGDQYMFGEEILFAPIVSEGQTSRQVYLPNGIWIDVNEKKEYTGGCYVEMKAELEQFIAFVKKGSEILEVFQ